MEYGGTAHNEVAEKVVKTVKLTKKEVVKIKEGRHTRLVRQPDKSVLKYKNEKKEEI